MDPAARFLADLNRGAPGDPSGLYGRILRGRDAAELSRLSDDPDRRLVFAVGADGLAALARVTGAARFDAVGYTPDYVAHLRQAGYQFRLAVFPLEPVPEPATWRGVAEAAERAYPRLEGRLVASIDAVAAASLSEHEAAAGAPFREVGRAGRTHPGFFTAARLAASTFEPWQVRAFFYHELHLTELFAGDGWTRTPDWVKTLREYLVPAVPLSELSGVATAEF